MLFCTAAAIHFTITSVSTCKRWTSLILRAPPLAAGLLCALPVQILQCFVRDAWCDRAHPRTTPPDSPWDRREERDLSAWSAIISMTLAAPALSCRPYESMDL